MPTGPPRVRPSLRTRGVPENVPCTLQRLRNVPPAQRFTLLKTRSPPKFQHRTALLPTPAQRNRRLGVVHRRYAMNSANARSARDLYPTSLISNPGEVALTPVAQIVRPC